MCEYARTSGACTCSYASRQYYRTGSGGLDEAGVGMQLGVSLGEAATEDVQERVSELATVERVEERVEHRVGVAEPQHELVQRARKVPRREERPHGEEREVGHPA